MTRVFACVFASACVTLSASAQVYPWANWTSTGPTSASATDTFGAVNLLTSIAPGIGVTTPWPIQFDNVPFTPVLAPTAAAQNLASFTNWSFFVDCSGVSQTNGLVVGIGNIGHGPAYLPYQLQMFDTSSAPMPLTSLNIIGSYDHTWLAGGIQFNDDISLNTANGQFVVNTVPGLNDINSDMLLFSLPANVGYLRVSTVFENAGDTINVVVAAPAPGAIAMLGVAGLVAVRRRRS